MFKYRIRMFFNELKVLVLMRSGSRRAESEPDPDRRSGMRGLGVGGCGWPPFDCTSRDDEEEYYGTDPRPRSLAFEEKDPKLQAGLDAVSLTSTMESGMRSPQCRICFQGPEQVSTSHIHAWVPIQNVTLTRSMCLWFYRFVISRLSSVRYRPLSWCLGRWLKGIFCLPIRQLCVLGLLHISHLKIKCRAPLSLSDTLTDIQTASGPAMLYLSTKIKVRPGFQ